MVDAPPASFIPTGARPRSFWDELDLLNILNGTGVPERAAALNELLNPLAAIPRAQQAAGQMLAPDRTGLERVGSLGQMLGEVAGVVAPMAGAAYVGKPAINALAEGLTGVQTQAGNALSGAGDAGQRFAMDESGALRLPSVAPILNDFRVKRGVKIGGGKIWRGVSEESGDGMASYGQGLYTTTNRKYAEKFGNVSEMGADDIPKNALRFDTVNDYQIWLQQAEKAAGFKSSRARREAGFVEPDDFIRAFAPDVDGIQIGKGSDATLVKWADPKTASTTPEGKAQTILDMLQSGRANEVTDEMLDLGDPVANARLNQYLYRNYDLPMDEASRMQRAGEMGFDTGTPLYHGTKSDISAIDPSAVMGGNARGAGFYATDNPSAAGGYATGGGMMRIDLTPNGSPNVIPMIMRGNALDEAAVLSKAEINQIARATGGEWSPKDLNAAFDRAYPATGQNVAQTLSYLPDQQNEVLQAAGYTGRFGPAVASSGRDFVAFDPTAIRSRFARFDPRLSHLKNLSAGIAGVGFGGAAMAPQDAQAGVANGNALSYDANQSLEDMVLQNFQGGRR